MRGQRSAVVTYITRHFKDEWLRRMGGSAPTLDGVNRIIDGAEKLRGNLNVMCRDGMCMVHKKLLAEYWNHRVGVIIRVDESNGRAVTVITPKKVQRGKKRPEKKDY